MAETSPIKLVRDQGKERPLARFCGHCGREPESPPDANRVCRRCGMGLVLQASADVAPKSVDPFLIVDSSLNVCAVSRRAERLLGVVETDAVNRHIGEFLVPADSEAADVADLAALLTRAASDDEEATSVMVRPTNVFGVRYWARVGSCGPPNAALLVLAD